MDRLEVIEPRGTRGMLLLIREDKLLGGPIF